MMATPVPGSSSELLFQVLKASSVIISSSYKQSKYDFTKPGGLGAEVSQHFVL